MDMSLFRYEFNRKKFAEYMCRDLKKGTEEFKNGYEVCYLYPYEQALDKEDFKHMLKEGILKKVEEDNIVFDEYMTDYLVEVD